MNASSPTPAAAGAPKASPGKALVGASGIGLAIVELARDGYAVVMADRNGELAAREAAALRAQGWTWSTASSTWPTSRHPRAGAGTGALAALVNNAGLFDERKFFDVSSDDYRRMYE